jgi:hypothetical protein
LELHDPPVRAQIEKQIADFAQVVERLMVIYRKA